MEWIRIVSVIGASLAGGSGRASLKRAVSAPAARTHIAIPEISATHNRGDTMDFQQTLCAASLLWLNGVPAARSEEYREKYKPS